MKLTPEKAVEEISQIIDQFDPDFDIPEAALQDIANILDIDKAICDYDDDDDDDGNWGDDDGDGGDGDEG